MTFLDIGWGGEAERVHAALEDLGWGALDGHDGAAGLIPDRSGPSRAGELLASPLGLVTRLARGTIIGWSIGITLGAVAIGSLLGSVADLADDEVIQEFLRQLGGSAGTIEDIFVATEVRFVAVSVAAAGVALLLRLVGAERGGLGEVVLTTPVSRTRWYAAHVAVSLVLVTALMALFGLVLGVVGSAVTPLAPSVGAAVGAALSTVPAIWVVVGVAALLCGALPRVAPLAWGVLLVAFVVGELGTTMNLPSWVIDASPFAHLSQLPGGEFEPVPAVWLTLIAAALIVAGWAAYRRRDAV